MAPIFGAIFYVLSAGFLLELPRHRSAPTVCGI